MAFLAAAAAALLTWLCLAVVHGRFWRTSIRLPPRPTPRPWPAVVAIVPARNEADVLRDTLPLLVSQEYPGRFRVVVVDDASDDQTGSVAKEAGADVVRTEGPPPGWAGKVAAMARGVAAADDAELFLFTDADIRYSAGCLTALVEATSGFDMVSQMVRLRAHGRWERVIVPAFVYFFAQLYPFGRVNSARSRVAAAAGGCMLVRKAALEEAGGLQNIAGALIDDVSLARLLKSRGNRIWLGLTPDIESVREYPMLKDLWRMVSRSAYTQLRYSPLLLCGTVLGMALVYLVPPAATIAGAVMGDVTVTALGAAAWALMTATFLPMLRFYRLSALRAPALPLIALLYLAMTIDSARRHALGRGGAWKGRVALRPKR